MNNKLTNKQYWNDIWYAYGHDNESLLDSDFYFGRSGLFMKLLARKIGSINDKTILELGGGGKNLRLLAMKKWGNADVTALDFSEYGLEKVQRLFRANQSEATYIQSDVLNWMPDKQHDVVTHWGLLEHFVDPSSILKQSHAALKPGGSLIFSMPNMETVAAKLWEKWSPDNWSKHIYHSNKEISIALNDLGFIDIQSFYYGIPCFKPAEWEYKSVLQWPFNFLQKVGSASARVLPIFYVVGNKYFSMERGFVARKI